MFVAKKKRERQRNTEIGSKLDERKTIEAVFRTMEKKMRYCH